MDVWRQLELLQFVIILAYLLIAWGHESHLSRALFCLFGGCLFVDVFVFHGLLHYRKPEAAWLAMNIPFVLLVGVYIYEKILRKIGLWIVRRVAVLGRAMSLD